MEMKVAVKMETVDGCFYESIACDAPGVYTWTRPTLVKGRRRL